MNNGGERTKSEICEKQVKGQYENGQVWSGQTLTKPQYLQQWKKKIQKEKKMLSMCTCTLGSDTMPSPSYFQIKDP